MENTMLVVNRDLGTKKNDELYHFGIIGQKWGIRRYQNPDGTLTEEGKSRYYKDAEKARKEIGEASRNPMTSVGSIEGRYMTNGFAGRKYRKMEETILKNTKNEAINYNKAVWEATKALTEKNAILFRSTREKYAKTTMENRRAAGKILADAIASVSTQYISENFSQYKQEKAKAWVYSQFAQNQDKEIRNYFDE